MTACSYLSKPASYLLLKLFKVAYSREIGEDSRPCFMAGLPALHAGEPGQVRKEAATAG